MYPDRTVGEGHGTAHLSLPASAALIGAHLDVTWFVRDPVAQTGIARSPTARLTLF